MATKLYRVAVAIAAVVAALRIGRGVWRLLRPSHPWDGGDLGMRWREVHAWFDGLPVYGQILTADYPPGSYTIFWPFLGWTDLDAGRWIWAASSLALLAWFIWLLVRHCGTSTGPLRAAVLLLPLVGYATYATLVNGQVSILVTTCLTAGTLILVRGHTLSTDMLGSFLVALSLVKPTLSVPVVWIAVLKPPRLRPAVLIGAIYLGFTWLAVSFQPAGVLDLIRGWLQQSGSVNMAASGSNLQQFLATIGLKDLFVPAGLAVGVLTGWWVYRHRGIDVWLLLGVTSIVAMIWAYHRPYDDVIMMLPLVALVRVAVSAPERDARVLATVLACALGLMALEHPQVPMVNPTHGLLTVDIDAVEFALNNLRFGVWLAVFVFLVREAHRAAFPRRTTVRPAAAPAAPPMPVDHPAGGALRAVPGGRWIAVCASVPLALIAGACVWLAVEQREVLNLREFLRDVPAAVALALFLASAVAVPVMRPRGAPDTTPLLLWGIAGLVAAAVVIGVAFALVSLERGPGEAVRNLSQLYTGDDVPAYGSHWRHQLLSTLWFGLAVPLVTWAGARWFGAPVPSGSTSSRLGLAAWLYFVGVSTVFGLGLGSSPDPGVLKREAWDILTHLGVTLPLGLGLVAIVHRLAGIDPGVRRPHRPAMARIAGALAIPACLVAALPVIDARAPGQNISGMASMLAAHVSEQALAFVLIACLVVSFQALRLRAHVMRVHPHRS